jgi:hypothetical protein
LMMCEHFFTKRLRSKPSSSIRNSPDLRNTARDDRRLRGNELQFQRIQPPDPPQLCSLRPFQASHLIYPEREAVLSSDGALREYQV